MPWIGAQKLRADSEAKYHEKYAHRTDECTASKDKIAKNAEPNVKAKK